MIKRRRIPIEPLRVVTSSGPEPPPSDLHEPEVVLWRALTTEYRFDDPGSLELLEAAMRARQRARQYAEEIDRDGAVWRDNKNNLRPHPLIAAEKAARRAYCDLLQLLHLDAGLRNA